MRALNDTKTMDLFPPQARMQMPPLTRHEMSAERQAADERRKARDAAKWEARRWVVVTNPGTEDEDTNDHLRFSTHAEALRSASNWGVRFDVMFRDADGNLTTDF